jgi:hypothetical protein
MKRTLGLAFVILCGCSSGGGGGTSGTGGAAGSPPLPSTRIWNCLGSSSATCTCNSYPPDTTIYVPNNEHCVAYSCCILTETSDPMNATCKCNDTSPSCSAEAASQPGAQVVTQCPPGAEDPHVTACAAQSVNCRWDYLNSKGLDGCCDGNICKPDTNGIPICQAATPTEISMLAQCRRDSRASATGALTIANRQLVTSAGTVTFDTVGSSNLTAGPNGCLNSLDVTLRGASSSCTLELRVEVVGGKLVVTYIFATLSGCQGYSATTTSSSVVLATNPATIDFAANTVACDGGLIIESYVLSGTFDFHIKDGPIGGVTFSDQHLVLNGYVQSFTDAASCPVP